MLYWPDHLSMFRNYVFDSRFPCVQTHKTEHRLRGAVGVDVHSRFHTSVSVQRRGWAGIKNGKLLALAAGEFDVLLTADKGMEYQQNLSALPVSILVVLARSNRMEHLSPTIPLILETLQQMTPRTLRKITASYLPDAGQ